MCLPGKSLLKNDYEKMRSAGNNPYCFTDGHNLFVDASDPLNSRKARYMKDNDVDPNVVVKRVIYNAISRIAFKTIKDVPKDQELCYDYGYTLVPWRVAQFPGIEMPAPLPSPAPAPVSRPGRIARSVGSCHQ